METDPIRARKARTNPPPDSREAGGSVLSHCTLAARHWWQTRRLLAQLGSDSEQERGTAAAWFVAQGEKAVPMLRRALHGPVGQACGAAAALAELDDSEGIRVVLARCYDEEWLLRSVRDGYLEGLYALRTLGRGPIGEALHDALTDAARERSFHACLAQLVVGLSGLRVLAVFEGPTPYAWWERGLRYGHKSLRGLPADAANFIAFNLTDCVRVVAVRGLLADYPERAFRTLTELLDCEDTSVGQSAIAGLIRLRDRRALPALQAIAFASGHPLASAARRAVEAIAGRQADSLVLLRASQSETPSPELLRPSAPTPAADDETQTLLRPLG
jgi:HEAT repeat protein